MQPVGDKILVLPIEEERVTKAGIILPNVDSNRQKGRRGTIVSASPTVPMKAGETVIFAPRAGKPVEIDGVPHLVLSVGENDNEVFAVL